MKDTDIDGKIVLQWMLYIEAYSMKAMIGLHWLSRVSSGGLL
jgi:hypothetical protein